MAAALAAADPALPPFVAIGGVGGSGTRLIAALVAESGIFIGDDLNDSLDNLAFTLLFKRHDLLSLNEQQVDQDLALFAASMSGTGRPMAADEAAYLMQLAGTDRADHSATWLHERARALVTFSAAARPVAATVRQWGWKEPNTHILLPALIRNFPALRYIHVVRNGLDMAFSSNQNQLHYWADALLGESGMPGPARALAYWCAVQERARTIGASMGDRFLWLDYDQFCLQPEAGLARLQRFLGLPGATDAMRAMIAPPKSIGRFRHRDCSMFPARDLDRVARLGFSID